MVTTPAHVRRRPGPHAFHVLIVDADGLVGTAVRATLSASVQVHLVRSPAEARAALDRDDPGLILLDLAVPADRGDSFYAWLESKRPDLLDRVVFLSEGGFTAETRLLLRRTGHPVLMKPVHRDALFLVADRFFDRRATG